MGRMEMLGGMLILRGVATTNMTTTEAFTQVHPYVSHLQALLATLCARCHFFNLIEMCTLLRHMLVSLLLVLLFTSNYENFTYVRGNER